MLEGEPADEDNVANKKKGRIHNYSFLDAATCWMVMPS